MSQQKENKASQLRKIFKKKGIIRIVGAHDGLSAKLVEKNGFDGVWASGLEISTSFAVPDANILTMSQYLEVAKTMNDAVSIPIIADCDTGYGNSNNVMYMVKKYESAGIAAVVIEDKQFPKVNSFIPGRQELAPLSEFVGKILAAKSVQEHPDFMVIARVEALIAGWGQEEALRRANAYVDAGADAILIHSKSKTPDEIIEFIHAWNNKSPLVVVPTTYSAVTAEELEKLGIKMVIYANHGIRASIKAMEMTFSAIAAYGTTKPIEKDIASMEEVFELQGMSVMKLMEKKYYRPQEPIKVIIPAAGSYEDEISLKDIMQDIPMPMIDIRGKSLLQRQQETLNTLSIQDITVVGGHRGDKIQLDGVAVIQNNDYKNTRDLESIMCARDKLEGKVLICYSDILFDADVIDKLLKSMADISILADPTYVERTGKKPDMDLVSAESPPMLNKRRILSVAKTNYAVKIGTDIPEEQRHYEFTGITFLSAAGTQKIKDWYEKSKIKYANRSFHTAPNFKQASLTDLLQEMIDGGEKIAIVEITSGWMEVHTMENYKLSCDLLAGK
ncbi:MAG: phosphoenolpyruvate mutase [bacterium]